MHKLSYWTSRRVIGTVLFLNILMLVLGFGSENIAKHYGENMAGTFISIILLLLLGVTNLRIFTLRRRHLIWLIMGIGFFFLAYDERFMFHEGLDKAIHRYFQIKETSMTDRFDDYIVGLYAIFGIGALYFSRKEITRHPVLFSYLGTGFILVAVSVSLDIISNDDAVLQWAGVSETILPALKKGFRTLEEVAKLMAEAIFLAGFLVVLRRVKAEA